MPLKKPKHILETIKKLISKNYNGVYTVSETAPKEHPYRQILINKGVPKLMIKSAKNIVARQQAPTFYNFNGACYSFKKLLNEDQSEIYLKYKNNSYKRNAY